MKEPDPILILGNDPTDVIAIYDPTIIGGEDVECSYMHTRNELMLARDIKRIDEFGYNRALRDINEARRNYQASLSNYFGIEQALEIGLGDIIGEHPYHEEVMGEMRVAYGLTNQDIRQASRIASTQRALSVLDKQSKTLEGITSNLNRKLA